MCSSDLRVETVFIILIWYEPILANIVADLLIASFLVGNTRIISRDKVAHVWPAVWCTESVDLMTGNDDGRKNLVMFHGEDDIVNRVCRIILGMIVGNDDSPGVQKGRSVEVSCREAYLMLIIVGVLKELILVQIEERKELILFVAYRRKKLIKGIAMVGITA